MTSTQLALLAAICSHPRDDTPRLVLADWLDENAGTVPCPACEGKRTTRQSMMAGKTHRQMCEVDIGDQPCHHCIGSGTVSNGFAERAEFIRVQCELARLEHRLAELLDDETDWDACTGNSAKWCPNCGDCICRNPEDSLSDADCPIHSPESPHLCLARAQERQEDLRQRERELWPSVQPTIMPTLLGVAHYIFTYDRGHFEETDPQSPNLRLLVRRGFVGELRADAATILGGVCPGCIEPGELDDGDPRCRLCSGSGRTEGLARNLIWHPSLTDVCPRCGGRESGTIWLGDGRNPVRCSCTNGRIPSPCPPTAQPVTRVVLTTEPDDPTYRTTYRFREEFGPHVEWVLPTEVPEYRPADFTPLFPT